jgi:hypothetical protein
MCYECHGIDQTIGHYHRLKELTTDQQTLVSIRILIAKLEADKMAHHPDTARTGKPPLHLIAGRFRHRRTTEPPPKEKE